ncbi:hypothetical protein AG1IA_01261 [Rhizoctonia solani AG-1 IA]|uniref:Uncharacterized protein n=1 Tax=Thanatephorus cucumeris (strain AG1-IA) TaxID=983506 RepID=L8X3D5_THACA|nr:hypothetical protein AG1IA_01261 [Rhizoctonia solani AG-1 IA]
MPTHRFHDPYFLDFFARLMFDSFPCALVCSITLFWSAGVDDKGGRWLHLCIEQSSAECLWLAYIHPGVHQYRTRRIT